jgi:hypothetical protein
MSDPIVIKRGMRIVFKPEWRGKGEDKYTIIAVTDQHPHDGGFNTSPLENTMWLRPIQIGARAHMVESAEPYLPVVTITFLGLERSGARCQMRRMLGDLELSLTTEVIVRSTFQRLFRRLAKDCKPGTLLQSGVEFPVSPEGTHDVI